jgi:hypothetical protein
LKCTSTGIMDICPINALLDQSVAQALSKNKMPS